MFWVQDHINVGRLGDREVQEGLETSFDSIGAYSKCLKVLTNEVFDPIYSVLCDSEEVSLTIRKELIQHLVQGLKNLLAMIEKTNIIGWVSQNFLSESTISQLIIEEPQCRKAIQIQNALSAYVYLITQFLADFAR